MAEPVAIEVACALPGRQVVVRLEVPVGTTLLEAVQRSGLPGRFPEIEVDPARLGVFGKLRKPDEAVKSGDRVEIYRPLKIDPKEQRRQRAGERGSG